MGLINFCFFMFSLWCVLYKRVMLFMIIVRVFFVFGVLLDWMELISLLFKVYSVDKLGNKSFCIFWNVKFIVWFWWGSKFYIFLLIFVMLRCLIFFGGEFLLVFFLIVLVERLLVSMLLMRVVIFFLIVGDVFVLGR